MAEMAKSDETDAQLKFQIKTFMGGYTPVRDRLRLDAIDGDGNKQ